MMKQPKCQAAYFENLSVSSEEKANGPLRHTGLNKPLVGNNAGAEFAMLTKNFNQNFNNKLDELILTITDSIFVKIKENVEQYLGKSAKSENTQQLSTAPNGETAESSAIIAPSLTNFIDPLQNTQNQAVVDAVNGEIKSVGSSDSLGIMANLKNVLTDFFQGKDFFKSITQGLKKMLKKPAKFLTDIFKGTSLVSNFTKILKSIF